MHARTLAAVIVFMGFLTSQTHAQESKSETVTLEMMSLKAAKASRSEIYRFLARHLSPPRPPPAVQESNSDPK